jgi:hypothetical protein
LQLPVSFPSIAKNTFNNEVPCTSEMLVFVMKFDPEPVQKGPGIAALEFLYYRIKYSNHSCKETEKREIIH